MAAVVKAGKGPGPYTSETSWIIWEERFEFFIKLRGITDAETKKLLFFWEIGPSTKSFAKWRCQKMSATCQLWRSNQTDVRTVHSGLLNPTSDLNCQSGMHKDSVDMCLSSLFINGLKNDSIRAELIKKGVKEVKFKDAVETAVLLEQSELDAEQIGGHKKAEVAKVFAPKGGRKSKAPTQLMQCHRCGRNGHRNNECPNKDSKCRKCGNVGHWAVMCKTKQGSNWPKRQGKPVHQVNTECQKAYDIGTLAKSEEIKSISVPPAMIKLQLAKKATDFELDYQLKSDETKPDLESNTDADSTSSNGDETEDEKDGGQPTDVDEEPNDPPTLDNPPLRRSSRERRPRQIFDPSK
ncbi:hypothetical protein niasHS_011713 [Heterodera schachtii]|uniref:CCHC-type domain-containing protein n=1 Tax=Heterodera schachtii TaxID=97005 RepID=A0ABD2IN28_HETSC